MSSKQKKNSWTTFKRLFGYVTPYWELKVVAFVVVLTTSISVLSPAIIGSIIDTVSYVTAGDVVPEATGIESITNMLLLPVAERFSVWN